MPLYIISHKDPISPTQRDGLAAAVTKIHTTVFTTPSLFVNVKFEDASDASYYVGGKPARVNAIHAHVRPGSSRPRSMYDDLCRQLRQAWEHNLSGPSLDTIFVHGTIIAGEEQGIMLPEAGNDAAWMKENMPEFERRARAGDEEMRVLVEECRALGVDA
ncbi:hypothetical protein DIS24_g4248 [Lasiodiplodia hormozganensis]|uniref:Tautomerase cis-CaaD-like domain-containing protein n=1 Tax=Lasiodiplodia hormozganensis TaxID=869390 RepID=A0AA40D3C4_9PEZI|nr:hypothetical protein DIS24_g4248 [Lasiodiplodia hormozganensis]